MSATGPRQAIPLAMQAPVVVASTEHSAVFDALGDRYVSEFFGLRPEVLLALYVDRGLWERFLAKASRRCVSGRLPRCQAPPLAERCGTPPAVALWRTTSAP